MRYGSNKFNGLAGPFGVNRKSSVLSPFPAGTMVAYLGDSILAYNTYSSSGAVPPEYSQQYRGEITWLNLLDTRQRIENFRDTTKVWGPYIGYTGTLGANPFSTTNGSPTVTVTHNGHGIPTGTNYGGGADYVFAGAVASGGLTLNGEYPVVSVPTINTFTITAGANATSSATGGGSSVTFNQRGAAAAIQYYGKAANYGCAGDHTDGSLDLAQVGNGFAYSNYVNGTSAKIIILAIGANDINSSVTALATFTKIIAIVNALRTKGLRVIVCTVRPRGLPITDTLPSNPFSTTNGSSTVVVSHPGQAYSDGQQVTFTGATATGGLTLTGPYTIQSTNFAADSYKITAGSTATSTATGGGAGITVSNSGGYLYAYNDVRWQAIADLNAMILGHAWPSGVITCDLTSAYVNSSVTCNDAGVKLAAKRNFLVDGVHPSDQGAYAGAKLLLPAVQSMISPGTWYETDPTAGTNYMRNGGLQNTTGIPGTNVSGQLPQDWTIQITGTSSLTVACSKSNVATGIDKMSLVLTPGGTGTVADVQSKPLNQISYNQTLTGKSTTVTPQSVGANPIVKIAQSGVSNGHPVVGSQVTFSNVSGTASGVDITGTWTVVSLAAETGSSLNYFITLTGQTSTSTSGASVTADTNYSSANLFPMNSWVRFGCYVEITAWDKWRSVLMQMSTRNGSSGIATYRAGRAYATALRYFPNDNISGWMASDPVKLTTENLTNCTNIQLLIDAQAEDSGGTTGTLSYSRPFFRTCADPQTVWS